MNSLPNNLYTSEKTRELDSLTINEFGVSGTVLMERAGTVAYEEIKKRWPHVQSICVVCGTGNNGGDGFVVARLAKEDGIKVDVQVVGDQNNIAGDALAALQRMEGAGVGALPYKGGKLPFVDVIVDGLFGTGLNGEIVGDFLLAVRAMNQHDSPIISLDIPSGLEANTGQILGRAVKADCTVSFIGLNQGILTASGPDHCGELVFSDLGIVDAVYAKVPPSAQLINNHDLLAKLKKRPRDSNKGMYGHVLIIGGDIGMGGAARMAGEAALRTGAGLVSLATRYAHASVINVSRPEIMSCPVERPEEIDHLLEKASVIAIGPGLGMSEWASMLYGHAVASDKPMVIDADALNLLANKPMKRNNWVLTPHPGEAARLLNKSTDTIQADRFTSVSELANQYGGTVVLKGCGSLVQTGEHSVLPKLCHLGNAGMASGGMGDVLTGVIAGLIAQGLSLDEAAQFGVWLHAHAGDIAAKGAGERGMLASDLMPTIRRLVNSV